MIVVAVVGIIFGATLASGPWMWYVVQLTREHAEAVQRVYEKLLAFQAATAQESAEAITRLATTGSPVAIEGRVEDREPDPIERASRMVSETTIAAGVGALKEEYRKHGITLTDEELRDEVTLLMGGLVPALPGA